jgi:hypothetical protein
VSLGQQTRTLPGVGSRSCGKPTKVRLIDILDPICNNGKGDHEQIELEKPSALFGCIVVREPFDVPPFLARDRGFNHNVKLL